MADTTNLSQFLSDVANAIRTKKETTEQIPAENFDQEILSIETGPQINNQDKEITENGTYIADEGYTGLGTVIVNVPQENLQEQLNAQDLIIQQLQEELAGKAGGSGESSDYNAKLVPTNGRIIDYITEISTQLDTSSVTNMRYMFENCKNLITIPLLDTSNVTNMSSMFNGCTNLTTIPLLDTSNVTDMYCMFNNCTNLTTIPLLNTSNVTDITNMFTGCTSLSDESLNNILAMCANATSYTDTKTLKFIGLTSAQVNKCKTLSNYQAFLNAGWTTGY